MGWFRRRRTVEVAQPGAVHAAPVVDRRQQLIRQVVERDGDGVCAGCPRPDAQDLRVVLMDVNRPVGLDNLWVLCRECRDELGVE